MSSIEQPSGIIFNIQKFSVHDGPGIRTLVFFKGCPLRCLWCSNPESQVHEPELSYNEGLCIKCGSCAQVCHSGAVTMRDDGPVVNRSICRTEESCLCQKLCPSGALSVYGKKMTVEEIMEICEQDEIFYSRTQGGITLGGGEPLFQPNMAITLLKTAREHHLHTAMETCGAVKREALLEACRWLDTLFMDIKCLDDTLHRKVTGVSNERILSNLEQVRKNFPDLDVTVRTPVIPGINDTEEEIANIAAFVHGLGVSHYELLAYHRYGEQKYRFLGRTPSMPDVQLDEERFNRLKLIAAS